jgi:hypothetical protein
VKREVPDFIADIGSQTVAQALTNEPAFHNTLNIRPW